MKTTRSVKLLLSAGTALFLVGCASQYTPVTQLQGNAFTKHLYYGYTTLAQAEEAEHDWSDRDYFLGKAAKAAAGEAVAATAIDARTFPGDLAIDAMVAQAKMKSLLEGRNAAAFHPGPAAKLQVAYDCYLQELEENLQPADIQACKDEFDHQAARLEDLMKPAPVVAKPARAPAPEPAPIPGPFNIYFDFDSVEISDNYLKTIKAIADNARQADVTKVNIYGHADRSGDVSYNSRLGLQRAMAVQRALRASGLDQGVRMSVSTKGEDSPRVDTADGVKERLNRRVELVLSR